MLTMTNLRDDMKIELASTGNALHPVTFEAYKKLILSVKMEDLRNASDAELGAALREAIGEIYDDRTRDV